MTRWRRARGRAGRLPVHVLGDTGAEPAAVSGSGCRWSAGRRRSGEAGEGAGREWRPHRRSAAASRRRERGRRQRASAGVEPRRRSATVLQTSSRLSEPAPARLPRVRLHRASPPADPSEHGDAGEQSEAIPGVGPVLDNGLFDFRSRAARPAQADGKLDAVLRYRPEATRGDAGARRPVTEVLRRSYPHVLLGSRAAGARRSERAGVVRACPSPSAESSASARSGSAAKSRFGRPAGGVVEAAAGGQRAQHLETRAAGRR